jgi:cysteine desulfurase family protein
MDRIYLDNSATSFPKPEGVLRAMVDYATHLGASPGRGAYFEARESGKLLDACRERLCALFGGEKPEHVIFTLNASDALNLAIHGLARPGDHVVTTHMEHNSVLRPLNELERRGGVEVTRVACDSVTGLVAVDDIRRALRKNTRLVAIVHGSNVTGTLQPIRDIGQLAREHDIAFLVDAAQTLGHVPIDVEADHIDLLAFPGHKGLLGPLGTGALYIRPGIEQRMQTIRQGGTGSVSENDVQPDFLPDRFEPGSHNAIGLIGLSEGVRWVAERGVSALWQHERELVRTLLDELTHDMPGLTLYGPRTLEHRCGVFSVRVDGFARPVDLSNALEQRFGILTRPGIHCAPLAHKTVGSFALGGTTRMSFGPFTTLEHVKALALALRTLCREQARRTTAA